MYCTGRLSVDDKEYAMMRCKISIPGYKINNIGTVLAPPSAPSFTIKIESRQESNFHRWINDIQIKDHVKLKFSSVNMDGQSKTFDLYDVRCVRNYESFDSNAADPMSNAITLIPGILVAEGVLLRVQKWKIQDPSVIMGQVTSNVIARPSEEEATDKPVITDAYWTDMDGNKLEEPLEGEVKLVVHTTNGVGRPFDFDLTNPLYHFKQYGSELTDDKLLGYVISSEVEEILLEANAI